MRLYSGGHMAWYMQVMLMVLIYQRKKFEYSKFGIGMLIAYELHYCNVLIYGIKMSYFLELVQRSDSERAHNH